MHDLVCLLRREQVLPLPHADEGHRVDQQRHPEVPRGEAGPHERVEQVGGGGELALETMIVKSVDTKENASYLTTLYSTVQSFSLTSWHNLWNSLYLARNVSLSDTTMAWPRWSNRSEERNSPESQ